MLLYRVLSSIIAAPLLILAIWKGSWILLIVTAFFLVVGLVEIHTMLKKIPTNHSLTLSILGGLLFLLSAYFNLGDKIIGLIFTVIILANLVKMVFSYPKYRVMDLAATVFSTLYVGWLLTHFYLIRQLDKGFYFLLLMLFSTWATDTFAYFVGVSLGRHKLAPVLSPKKSIEGSVGGVLGAMLVALSFYLIKPETNLLNYVIIGILVGTLGQLGDLAESAIKRITGVKDSGNLIPGHGGVLDRIDSILFTAPLVYYFTKLFIIT